MNSLRFRYPFVKLQAEFYADYIVHNTDTGTYDVPLACAQEGCGGVCARLSLTRESSVQAPSQKSKAARGRASAQTELEMVICVP